MKCKCKSAKHSICYVVGPKGQDFSFFFYFLGIAALDLQHGFLSVAGPLAELALSQRFTADAWPKVESTGRIPGRLD